MVVITAEEIYMSMTIQAKRLKQALRDVLGKNDISVRTERFVRNIKGEKRFYEFGLAYATVWKHKYTPEQLDKLRADERIEVYLDTDNCLYLKS